MGGLDDEAEEGDVIGEEDISKYTVGALAATQGPLLLVPVAEACLILRSFCSTFWTTF